MLLLPPDKTHIEYAVRMFFEASNNETEYEALLAGLGWAELSLLYTLMFGIYERPAKAFHLIEVPGLGEYMRSRKKI